MSGFCRMYTLTPIWYTTGAKFEYHFWSSSCTLIQSIANKSTLAPVAAFTEAALLAIAQPSVNVYDVRLDDGIV